MITFQKLWSSGPIEVPYSTILLLDILSFGMAKATQEMHGYHVNEDDFFLTPDLSMAYHVYPDTGRERLIRTRLIRSST